MGDIDFGQVAKSYACSREDIPVSLMDSLFIRSIFFEGKKVVDLGCGTGALTRKIAMRKADVVGIDPSKDSLERAKTLNRQKNYIIPYRQGSVEDTGLQDSQYDIVIAMRTWHSFNRPKALKEIKRILKVKGKLIVIDFGFLTGSATVEKSFQLLTKYEKNSLKQTGLKAESKQSINRFPVEWFEEWQTNGFELMDCYKLNYTAKFSKQEWIERVGSISWLTGLNEAVRKRALTELAEELPDQEPYMIPHECNVCILRLADEQ